MDIDALPFLEVYFFIQKKNWMRKYLDNFKKTVALFQKSKYT